MYCEPLKCVMTREACGINQSVAELVIHKLTVGWTEEREVGGKTSIHEHEPVTLYQLNHQEINRFLVCGKCDLSAIDYADVKMLFRQGIDDLIQRVDRFNEYGFDPEISRLRRLERQSIYRETYREEIRDRRRAKDLEKRIKKLKGDK